jgi:hypothetical protein
MPTPPKNSGSLIHRSLRWALIAALGFSLGTWASTLQQDKPLEKTSTNEDSAPIPTIRDVLNAKPGVRYAELCRYLPQATADELVTLGNDILHRLGSRTEGVLQLEVRLLMERWVLVAPQVALAAARKADGYLEVLPGDAQSALGACLEAWGEAAPEVALTVAANLSATATLCVLGGVSSKDAVRAYALAVALPRELLVSYECRPPLERILEHYVEQAPAQAVDAFTKHPLPFSSAYSIIVRHLITQDAAATIKFITTTVPTNSQRELWEGLLPELLEKSPETVRAEILKMPRSEMSNSLKLRCLTDWGKRDVNAAKAYAALLPKGPEHNHCTAAIAAGADIDTAWSLVERLGDLPPKSIRLEWSRTRSNSFPKEVRYWTPLVEKLAASDMVRLLKLSKDPEVLQVAMRSQPEKIISVLRQFPDMEVDLSQLTKEYLRGLSVNAMTAMLANQQKSVQISLVRGYFSAMDKPLVSQFTDAQQIPESLQVFALTEIARRGASATAETWALLARPFSPPAQQALFSAILCSETPLDERKILAIGLANLTVAAGGIGRMVELQFNSHPNNPEAIRLWVDSLSEGSGKDAAMHSVVWYFLNSSPDSAANAFAYALKIQNSAMRKSDLKMAYSNWVWRDRVAAEQALKASGLSEAEINPSKP